jgi:hypothetical protein
LVAEVADTDADVLVAAVEGWDMLVVDSFLGLFYFSSEI